MKEQTREDPKIIAAAERQMQAWAKNAEIADRICQPEIPSSPRRARKVFFDHFPGSRRGRKRNRRDCRQTAGLGSARQKPPGPRGRTFPS